MIKKVLQAIEKFLPKIVVIRRSYEENLIEEGWHTMKFGAIHWTIAFMGGDKKANEIKRSTISKKLIKLCIRDVKKDIEAAKKEMGLAEE